jgi:hypothetical protein
MTVIPLTPALSLLAGQEHLAHLSGLLFGIEVLPH